MISPDTGLTTVQVALLYAHDFTKLRVDDASDIVESLVLNPPTEHEIATVMSKRHDEGIVSIIDYFITGSKRLMSIIG